jgi:hypothetical protein
MMNRFWIGMGGRQEIDDALPPTGMPSTTSFPWFMASILARGGRVWA